MELCLAGIDEFEDSCPDDDYLLDAEENMSPEKSEELENPGNCPAIDPPDSNLRNSASFQTGCANGRPPTASVPPRNTRTDPSSSSHPMREKLKATCFELALLKIGGYWKVAKREGDLCCKCYYTRKRLVWEILEYTSKKKIEIQWSNIARLRARIKDNEPGLLEIELYQPPLFYVETGTQPSRHTKWDLSDDFTGGEASKFRRHSVLFHPGDLDKQYKQLLQCDNRLFQLSQQDYPRFRDPSFDITVPRNLVPTTKTEDFHGRGPRLINHGFFRPQMENNRPMIQPQQFHPDKNTVSYPYNINNSTGTLMYPSRTSIPHINSIPRKVLFHQYMTPRLSPLESGSLYLPESAAFQHQRYNNILMDCSDEKASQYSSAALNPSFSYDITNNAMIGGDGQFPSADNIVVDRPQVQSMMGQQTLPMAADHGLVLGSSEALNANIFHGTAVPDIAMPLSSKAPLQDACGNYTAFSSDRNSTQYVSRASSSVGNNDPNHCFTDNSPRNKRIKLS